jgi:hypothetical protein
MVEVFRTDVGDAEAAMRIVEALQDRHALYVVNFDLEDCDRVLRVTCLVGDVDATEVIILLTELGFHAEILPDEIPELSFDVLI